MGFFCYLCIHSSQPKRIAEPPSVALPPVHLNQNIKTVNRRQFCKLASLALAATAVKASGAPLAAPSPTEDGRLRRARVTVIRRNCFEDLQSRYLDDPEEGPCQRFVEGDTFEVDASCVATGPRGFCPKAWECVRCHVEGVLDPLDSTMCGKSEPDHAIIACCNDGTRPVVFKIEPID